MVGEGRVGPRAEGAVAGERPDITRWERVGWGRAWWLRVGPRVVVEGGARWVGPVPVRGDVWRCEGD